MHRKGRDGQTHFPTNLAEHSVVYSRSEGFQTSRRSTFFESMQLDFFNGELRETATQTDQKLREYQDSRLVQSLPSGKMEVDLRTKLALIA
jgi:hypothetical protein